MCIRDRISINYWKYKQIGNQWIDFATNQIKNRLHKTPSTIQKKRGKAQGQEHKTLVLLINLTALLEFHPCLPARQAIGKLCYWKHLDLIKIVAAYRLEIAMASESLCRTLLSANSKDKASTTSRLPSYCSILRLSPSLKAKSKIKWPSGTNINCEKLNQSLLGNQYSPSSYGKTR